MKNKSIFFYIGLAIAALIYILIYSPNLNPLYREGAFFWCVIITIALIISQTQSVIKSILGSVNKSTFKFEFFGQKNENNRVVINNDFKIKKWAIITLIVMWASYLAVNIGSSVLFNSQAFKDQMPEPVMKEFTSDIQAVDISQIPIVDASLAYKLADKKLGERPSLGSQVRLGEPTIQKVAGKLVWVVPLHHSGFFKWLTNMQGTPGYIVVSATNPQDINYIDSYKIKYHPNSYFFDDLLRKVRLSSALFTGIVDYSFELNDEGVPYWVITTYKNLRGFSLPEADGIIILNAQNGEMSRYGLNEIPEWVDRVQPEQFIIDQINNKGEYVHGIFNFSNKDKFKASPGHIIVYNNDRCYLFTGTTSVGIDGSATGFYMVDMVTKQPILYRISGATEEAAMSSAQGKVQDLGYKAASPIILNISNQPTYFMTLKDKEGLIKKYSYVSVKDYGIVGVGDTVAQAQENFEVSLRDGGIITTTDVDDKNKIEVQGKVVRIGFTVQSNQTIYNIMIDSVPDVVFTIPYDSNNKLSLTKENDIVRISYTNKDNKIKVVSFENVSINDLNKS